MQYVFGAGVLFIHPDGFDTGATAPMQVAALQGVSVDLGFSAKDLHDGGIGPWPLAVGRGSGAIPCKADYARFTAAGFNEVFFGGADPGVGMTRTAVDEPQTVAGSAATATNAAEFMEDLGVTDASDRLIFIKVDSSPVGLQYTYDDAGGYGFNASKNGTAVLLNYTYDDPTSGHRLDLVSKSMGFTPRFSAVLTETFNGKSMTLTLTTCAASKLGMTSKSEDFMLPSFSFAAIADDSGLVGTLSIEEGTDNVVPPPPSTYWITRAMPVSTLWRRCTYSPELNLFVAVGDGGQCITSPDGHTWTARSMPSSQKWEYVIWASDLGIFLAVADINAITGRSTDGINWTGGTLPTSAVLWGGLGWNGTTFVIVKNSPASTLTLTSVDGITWSQHAAAMPSSQAWDSCLWAPELGVFVAVPVGGAVSATSPDGITWTGGTMPSVEQWRDAGWNGTTLVCTVYGSINRKSATSADGLTWTPQTLPIAEFWTSVRWSPELSMFCMLGYGAYSLLSADGFTWSLSGMPSTQNWYVLAAGAAAFVALPFDASSTGAASLNPI